METSNQKPSEAVALLAQYNPASVAASTVTTGWLSAANFEAFMAIIAAGALGASATLDAKIQQAQDSSGTGVKDVSGTAITQLVKATDDNKQVIINLRAPQLDVNNAFTHFRLSMTVGTAASLLSATVLGFFPRYSPASGSNATSVAQIVG